MFDISWGELMLIGVVALIVIGPKELPGVLRMVGQWVGKIRRMAAEFQGQFHEAMREAEMADLKKQVDDLNDAARGLTRHFDPLSPDPPTPASSAPPDVPTPSSTPPATATVDATTAPSGDMQSAQPGPSAPETAAPPVVEKDDTPAASQLSPEPAPQGAEGGQR